MHTARNEDHVAKIAAEHGLRSHQTLWDRNKDRLHRATGNLLFKGNRLDGNGADQIDIPPPGERNEPGQTAVFNEFKVVSGDLFLRLRVLKDDFTALSNAPYELTVPGVATPFTGNTDSNGQVKHPIPPNTTSATFTVRVTRTDSQTTSPNASAGNAGALHGETPITWELRVGALNPICENAPDQYCVSGVQQRLNNININTALIDGINGPNTTAAIRSFQELANIVGSVPQPGVPDKAKTQEKLRKVHDGPSPVHPKDA